MRLERPSGIVELRHQLRKELKPHEQYNTGHEIPPFSAHLRAEVRCKLCQPEVQQKPVLHLLLACPLRRFPAIPGLPVPTSSQPPTSIPKRSLSSSLPQCQVMNSKKGKKYPLSIKRRGDICDTNYNLFAFQRIHKIIAKRP